MTAASFILPSFVLVMALALWARGLAKPDRGDLIAGCGLIVAMALLSTLLLGGSTSAPLLGIALIALAIDTLVAGELGGNRCPLNRSSRFATSTGLSLLGLLLLLVA